MTLCSSHLYPATPSVSVGRFRFDFLCFWLGIFISIQFHSAHAESPTASHILPISGVVQPKTLSADYFIQTGNPGNLRFIDDPENSGRKVLEMALSKKDPEAATSHRTEILGRKDALANGVEIRWYGFEIYLPKSWTLEPNPIVVAQLHGNDRLRLAPPVSLQIQGGRMFIMLQHNTNKLLSATPPVTGNSVRSYPWHSPLQKGRWLRFVVRTLWSSTPSVGELDLWMNDELILSQRNTPNTYETEPGIGGQNYAKTGVYAPYGLSTNDQISILTRGIIIGGPDATYDDIRKAFLH